MHYRNGRPAQNGDRVVQFGMGDGKAIAVGTLTDAKPGNDYCNGYIAVGKAGESVALEVACLCDCLRVDDLEVLLKPYGLDKRPEGK